MVENDIKIFEIHHLLGTKLYAENLAAERIQSALKAPIFLKATGEKKNVAFMRGSNPRLLKRYVHMGTKPSRGGRIVDKLGRDID